MQLYIFFTKTNYLVMEQTPSQMHVPVLTIHVKAMIKEESFELKKAFALPAMTLSERLQQGTNRRKQLGELLTTHDGHSCIDGNLDVVVSTAPDSIKKFRVPNLCANKVTRIFNELVEAFVPEKPELALALVPA